MGEAQKTASSPQPMSWRKVVVSVLGLLTALYVFLLGLALLGDAFKCLGGRGAGKIFSAVDNPIAGLMTGILSTVLVQSSSTSTSIVVGLVGSDQLAVKSAIPVIMGANIGTSVTNTLVSMGQSGDRLQLERAFSGATVHDMFNMLSVLTLLPIESIFAAINGEGGPLYWITKALTDSLVGGDTSGELFDSPIKAITKPVTSAIISNNKYVIYALSLGEPEEQTPAATNSSLCAASRRLAEMGERASPRARALLNRRMSGEGTSTACSHFYCVSADLDKNFKEISETSYKEELTSCEGRVLDPVSPCQDGFECYIDAGAYYQTHVVDGHIIKDGLMKDAGDVGGGILSLVIALLFLCGGLFVLCQLLHGLLMGRARKAIARATALPDYVAMLVGVAITIVVQSSSVVTSALTPLCGLGVLPLEKMLPLTLGANIGTTVTALLASLVTLKPNAVHIALCHLFFNIFGILLWFPIPIMRNVPLGAARLLGLYTSFYRFVPGLYILVAFVIVPAIALGVSSLFDAHAIAGIAVLALLLSGLVAFEYWWLRMEGCYKVISKEDREVGILKLQASNKEMRGEDEAAELSPSRGGSVGEVAGVKVVRFDESHRAAALQDGTTV